MYFLTVHTPTHQAVGMEMYYKEDSRDFPFIILNHQHSFSTFKN